MISEEEGVLAWTTRPDHWMTWRLHHYLRMAQPSDQGGKLLRALERKGPRVQGVANKWPRRSYIFPPPSFPSFFLPACCQVPPAPSPCHPHPRHPCLQIPFILLPPSLPPLQPPFPQFHPHLPQRSRHQNLVTIGDRPDSPSHPGPPSLSRGQSASPLPMLSRH